MNDLLIVLPMAFVMVAGPQIVAAVLLATSENPRRNSVYFLCGVAVATAIGVSAAYGLTGLFGKQASAATGDDQFKRIVEGAIAVLLVVLAWKVFQKRHSTDTPAWMEKLQTATPQFAVKIGVMLFLLMPSDLLTMVTVGAHLGHSGASWWGCLLFVALTVLLAGFPLLVLLMLGQRAADILPKIRDWMTKNSWIVSEIVIVFFLVMILKGLLGG